MEQAGLSGQEKDKEGREFMGNRVSKMLPLERCRNCHDNDDMIFQMSTGYHGTLEKLHSFSAAELFIHKIVFLPHYQVYR